MTANAGRAKASALFAASVVVNARCGVGDGSGAGQLLLCCPADGIAIEGVRR